MSDDKEEVSKEEITKNKGFMIYIDQDHIHELHALFQKGITQKGLYNDQECVESEQPTEEMELKKKKAFGGSSCIGGFSIYCGTL